MKRFFFLSVFVICMFLPSFGWAATIVSLDAEEEIATRYMQYSNPQWLEVALNTEPITNEQLSLLLLYQALLNPNTDLMALTLRYGADVNAVFTTQGQGTVPLLYIVVAEPQPADVVRFLLEAGADITARMSDNTEMTLLMVAAAKSAYSDVVQLLLDAGADPNATHKGKTALDFILKNASLKSSPAAERLRKETKRP